MQTKHNTKHNIYLIPGFFGFANLGGLTYFSHVKEYIDRLFRDQEIDATIISVHTHPTASIRRRTQILYDAIAESSDPDTRIHLIGHSTGGLDARLLTSPGTDLGNGVDVESIASRVDSVVTISTPHYGTPLASFFRGIAGAKLLRLFSLGTLYVLRYGSLPLSFMVKLGGLLTMVDGLMRRIDTLLDQLYEELLNDFSDERKDEIARLFDQMSDDQSLMTQLMPEAMDLFNASVSDRPGTTYGSVVTQGKKPSVQSRWSAGFSFNGHVMQSRYAWLYNRTGRMPVTAVPELTEQQSEALRHAYYDIPNAVANDGMVPTLSQPWGEVISVGWADHLDVVGNFDDRMHRPPHIDWLITNSGFGRPHFEALWMDITGFVINASVRQKRKLAGPVSRKSAKVVRLRKRR